MQNQQYFKTLDNQQLDYAIKDIVATMKISEQWPDNGIGNNKYTDQFHAALMERNRRNEFNVCKCCKKPL
jgi:hypothetical protein